jgi:hypothetical protein
MAETHTSGGVHCIYRTVKTFLLWYEQEFEPEAWHNPIRKVKPPKVPNEPLEPVPLQNISEMLKYSKAGRKYPAFPFRYRGKGIRVFKYEHL